jgi:ATP-dependent helicase/nuclease subunit A
VNAALPSDQQVRDRIRNDLDTTLIIEAAAGTGKTTALVNRIVSVIESGRGQLSQIVAVTFTEKAAGELKLRLRAEIEKARHDAEVDGDVRRHLDKALEQLEEARIGTIHSFCADLLRERPVEARVDPMFEVAPEDVASEMFDSAFDRWFEKILERPGEGMRRLLRRRDLSQRTGPREIARRAAYELLNWRDFDTPWKPSPFDRDSEIDAIVDEILALGKLAEETGPQDWLGKSLSTIARPVSEAIRLESVHPRDYDALESVLVTNSRGRHWDWRGYGGDFGDVERDEVFRRRDAMKVRLKNFRETAGANLAPMLRDELWPVVGIYEDIKRRAGRLDFLDLLLVARDLVRDNAAVRAELQKRFTHIFIDEFQDTDPLQAEILILLSASDPAESDWRRVRPHPGRLFIVGDPKQSIYRFRRADVALYQGVKQMLLLHGAALEHLTVSFRANPELQQMVNAAFAPLMDQESGTQPGYAPLMPFRPQIEGQPAIVALPVPEPYSNFSRITDFKIDESMPKAIAAFIKWLVDRSGWTVTEREAPDKRVAIRPRHICVLFRRMNSFGRDITRAYLRELEARHLPHVLVKGGSFNEREEVVAIRNVLGAIERPDDELLVFASLHGPLFALSDAALLEFRETIGGLHPFRKVADDIAPHLREVKDALDVIRDLHRGRNRRPIAETLGTVLSKTRAHAGIAIWPTGEQALANVMRIMDQARRYEARSGATSFRGFVDELEARADRDEASETPIVEEGTEGVRIMTVHRVKGLEFPIVILADPTCNETREQASRFVEPSSRLCAMDLAGCAPKELLEHADKELERDKEEAVRLLYVATTRARDLIVVPTVGDLDPFAQLRPGERAGWLDRLDPVIFPATAKRRPPLMPKHAGCPDFGDDSVLTRPEKAPLKNKSVMPGLHRPRDGEHGVVWWDPSRLDLQVEEQMGLRQNKLLQIDEKKLVSERGKEAYRAWHENRAATLAAGATPSMKLSTLTEISIAAPDAQRKYVDTIAIERTARDYTRPHGKNFGTLVHLAMLRTPFDADTAQVASVTRGAGRILGASDEEIASAATAVIAAFDSPLMRRASVAQTVMRECPLMLTLDDGVAVEGIADLVFAEKIDDVVTWTVVDFKTDAGISGRLDEYRAQIALYMSALERSTGCASKGAILWI